METISQVMLTNAPSKRNISNSIRPCRVLGSKKFGRETLLNEYIIFF
jgi:hypothetical protein